MAFKFVILVAFVAAANAAAIAPLAYHAAAPAVAYHAAAPGVAYHAAAPAVAYHAAAPAAAYHAAAPAVAYHAAAPAVAYHAAPAVYHAPLAKAVDSEYDPHPQYSYGYDVHDSLTGDVKSQHETRDGDVVHGSYSLLEADGSRRIVDYTADSVNGFNAVVRKEPAQVAVKAVHAAPVVHAAPHYQAPLAYYHH